MPGLGVLTLIGRSNVERANGRGGAREAFELARRVRRPLFAASQLASTKPALFQP